MLWIEHPSEPKELILSWQALPSVKDRLRWAVGRLIKVGDGAVFDYLQGDEFAALNLGRSPDDLKAAGFSGYPAFNPNPKRNPRRRSSGNPEERALEAFLRRLPPPSRPDFSAYLAHYLVREPEKLSRLMLLAVTEARLPSDGFSLVDPLDPVACRVDLVFEIAGAKYHGDIDIKLKAGDPLVLEAEPTNPTDPNAVMVKAAGRLIGYVNRLQAKTIGEWLRTCAIECWVARINGSVDAPTPFAFLRGRPLERAIAA